MLPTLNKSERLFNPEQNYSTLTPQSPPDNRRLKPHHWDELVNSSGISPEIALLNFQGLEGDEVLERLASIPLGNLMGEAAQWANRKVRRIQQRYADPMGGGWWCSGITPNRCDIKTKELIFEAPEYGRFKADTPRTPAKQLRTGEWVDGDKPAKYDAPAGIEHRATFLRVSIEAGYKAATLIGKSNEYIKRVTQANGDDRQTGNDGTRVSNSSANGTRPAQTFRLNRAGRKKAGLHSVSDRSSILEQARHLGGSDRQNASTNDHLCERESAVHRVRFRGFGEGRGVRSVSASDKNGIQATNGDNPRHTVQLSQAAQEQPKIPEFVKEHGHEEDKGFWPWYLSITKAPIVITEGEKKAASLISQGVVAISVPGVTMWHRKGEKTLHPDLKVICVKKRPVIIAFDRDENPVTVQRVGAQVRKMGEAFESEGCRVRVAVWPSDWGKGVDDVIVSKGFEYLKPCIDGAIALEDFRRDFRTEQLLETIKRYNSTSFAIERDTATDGFMPRLPEWSKGAIHVVNVTMNGGKTFGIGRDWVDSALNDGYHVVALAPLNSLGEQTARNWGIKHIHGQLKAESKQEFWEAVRKRPGITLCPDSTCKLPSWFWSKPVLLVIDEANQVSDHICKGDTFKGLYGTILTRIQEIARHAIESGGGIVLSEDGIPDRAIKFWQAISGAKQVRYFKHQRRGARWHNTVYSGRVSGFRSRLLNRLNSPEPMFYVSSSQRDCKRLEWIAKAMGKKVVRIDSETNENGAFKLFFTDPDQWLDLNQPDLLILSPSGKSGLSIQGNVAAKDAYFKEIWGYFPALDTDTHMQLLGRYRPPVPRHIYVPPFIMGDSEERIGRKGGIRKRLEANLRDVARLFEIRSVKDDLSDLESAIHSYLSEARTVSGAQKSIAQAALISRLEGAGHSVTLEQVEPDKDASQTWNDFQEMIWVDESEKFAAIEVAEAHTVDWAWRTLDSMESSHEARQTARKVLWRDEFPGMSFDDAETCYKALFKDYGAMRRGVQLWARAENPNGTKQLERSAVEAIVTSEVRAGHRIPKSYAQAVLLSGLGALDLLDGKSWSNTDPRAISIKGKALNFANEISYWLRLQIKPSQTPADICNKLVRKFGVEVKSMARPGGGNSRDRVYGITDLDHPVRQQLLEASRSKLSETASTICNREVIPLLQIVDAATEFPELKRGEGVRWRPGDVVRWVKTGGIALVESARNAFLILSDESGGLFRAPADELIPFAGAS